MTPWMRRFSRRALVALSACLVAASGRLGAEVRADGDLVTVENSAISLAFRGLNLASLKNLLTGEAYVSRPGPGWFDMSLQEQPSTLLQPGQWKIETDAATGASFAVLAASDATRKVRITVGLVPDSDEIFLRFEGKSDQTGVRSIFFGLQGFDPIGGRFLIPGQAGIYFDRNTTPPMLDLQYPTHWEAQFAIYERKQGGLLIYARDPRPYFKRIRASRQYGALDIGFDVFALGPWTNATETPEIEWRFRAFDGDWRQGVDAYRSWSESVWPMRQLPSSADWRHNINAVVTFIDTVAEYLEPLSKRLDPGKTLLYLANWRRDSYDTNYPDYTPGSSTAEFIKRAHELGFRVMLHTNALGVAVYNPAYERVFPYQLREPDKGDLVYWPQGLWPAGSLPPFFLQSFAFISPCSSVYRALLVDALRPMMEQLHPDALHLDAGGVMLNDGNGLVEGMTSIEGMIQLHKDLDAAFPGTVFSYESMTEPLTGLQNFAQRWNANFPPHPISTYLMGRRVTFYGFLNQTPPDEPGFVGFINRYEGQGVPPTFVLSKPSDLTAGLPGNERVLKLLSEWQRYDFRPDWDADWSSATFRYRSGDGETTAEVRDQDNRITLRVGEKTVYERVHGTTTADVTGFVKDWMAWSGDTLLGLDPEHEYWVEPGMEKPAVKVRISGLPENVMVSPDSFAAADYGLFQLSHAIKPQFDFVQAYPTAKIGSSYLLKDYQLRFGAFVEMSRATVAGQVLGPALLMQPPYQIPGAVVFVEYNIEVPLVEPVLRFNAGVSDFAIGSDGCWFVARVNDADAWKASIKRGELRRGEIDLQHWAGQTIRLRLIVHPGGRLSSRADLAVWSDFVLEAGTSAVPEQMQLTLPGDSSAASVSGGIRLVTGRSVAEGTEWQWDAEAVLPATFAVFTSAPQKIEVGESLLGLRYDVWKSYYGGWPFTAREGSNGVIQPGSSGGESVAKVLPATPPSRGFTHVTWAVTLPAGAKQLAFRASLADPVPPLPPDIDYSETGFEIKVNGASLWSAKYQATGWHDGVVDISPWAGQSVVVQLSCDALGQGTFNWTQWADLTVH